MRQHLFQGSQRVRITTAILLALGLAACDQQAAAPKAVSATACEDYGARICKEVGESSPSCASSKEFIELMPPEACAAGLEKIDVTLAKLGERRKKCDELTDKLCKDIGEGTETCDMVRTRTKEFPPERCVEMLKQYDNVLAELKRQEAKNKPLSEELADKIAEPGAPAFGPEDAKVTIVEFSDFQCPFCSRAATAANQVKEKYGDKVRFVFRQFPLSFHKDAHAAAEASLFAMEKGKFWEFHDKLFQNQSALGVGDMEGYAKELGLNPKDLKKALDDKTYAAKVDADLELGKEVSVDGTPTMFINGKRVGNPTDFAAISKQIDEALAN